MWRPQKQISPFPSSSLLCSFVLHPGSSIPQLQESSRVTHQRVSVVPCKSSNQREEKNVPGEPEGIVAGDGVRAAALAHAVQFAQRNVEAEEELQGVFGDGRGACVTLGAAVQAQGLTHLFEHKLFGYVIADRSAAWC